ncbi:sigma factor [Microbacterium sp. Leaf320]|uniref:sigma factor n=1 Tax=Microbacterium sp. Leaf320 TaxID=1736334 RepID=UPI000A9FCE5B|nr:sigma factor [Microbacterium sp. Leaf320]
MSRVPPRIGGDAVWGAEADLMMHIASGSQTAFAQLYDLTCTRIFGLILSVIDARESAEEVLEDTYVHVWAHAREFATYRGTASAWISEIARRRAVERVHSTADATATGVRDGDFDAPLGLLSA